MEKIEDVLTPRRFILEVFRKAGMVEYNGDKGDRSPLHPWELHDVETCLVSKELLQGLIDEGRIEIGRVMREEGEVFMQSSDTNLGKPKPLVIHFTRDVTTQVPRGFQPVVVRTPSPFPYKSDKAMPWRYDIQGSYGRQDASVMCVGASMPTTKITNISSMSGMMSSGHLFAPPELLAKSNDKGKTREDVVERENVGPVMNNKAPVKKPMEEEDSFGKKEIFAEEATKFPRIIQQSEFKVIEQLNKMPARIPLLGLLMHSKPHRKLLMKILNEAHVAHDISMEKFRRIVNNITASNYLTFTEEELPIEGRGHNKALHVSVKCVDHMVAKVLVENGSSLNVMPKTTLDKLLFDASYMRPSSMVVRAFDGSRRDVKGEIDLPIQIGPCTFQITFQVMDITPTYSCFLGRPWIHSIGVDPSSLHQKLKFVVGGQLIIVLGEEDILVSCLSSTPYVEAAEESLETSFQALEIMNSAYVESPPIQPHLPDTSLMVA